MEREEIKELLREVVGPNVELIDHERWVSLRCVFAEWKHAKGVDNTPSAGVSINEDGESIYHCFSCSGKNKGPLSWFLREYEKYTGESCTKLIREIEGNEFLGGSLPEWGSKGSKRKRKLAPLDQSVYLDLYESAVGHPYLRKRKIDDETAEYMGLLLDPEDSYGHERIMFPVYTPTKDLLGFTGRAVLDGVEPRVKDYHGLPKDSVLLGSHLLEKEDTFVVLVEGPFDCARMWSHGYPTVAALHAGLTEYQVRILLDIGKPVLLMLDNDQAGKNATVKIAEALEGRLPVSAVRYPKEIEGKPCPKDPGAMTRKQADRLVKSARIL